MTEFDCLPSLTVFRPTTILRWKAEMGSTRVFILASKRSTLMNQRDALSH